MNELPRAYMSTESQLKQTAVAKAMERAGIPVQVDGKKVPSQYPDMGVLVQQEYGAKEKDPISQLTYDHISRQDVTENAVYKVAVQLTSNKIG